MNRAIFCSVVLVFLLVSSVTWGESAPPEPNAKFVLYGWSPYIIPNNAEDYQYLFKYPITGFYFVNSVTPDRLSQIKVKDLKNGFLGTFDSQSYFALQTDKIVGFEDMARELRTLDEFGIEARKKEIIQKLIDCHRKYIAEQIKYLAGFNGTYRLLVGKFESYQGVKLNEYCPKDEGMCSVQGMHKHEKMYPAVEVKKDAFDFDKKLLNVTLLPDGEAVKDYIDEYKMKYGVDHWNRIGQKLFYGKVPISIEDAQRIFGGEGKTYCQTMIEVKLRNGQHKNKTLFDILKVTKLYYRGNTDSNPVLAIEVVSDKNRPLF